MPPMNDVDSDASLESEAQDAPVEERSLEFPAHDGYTIAGTMYRRVEDYDPDDVLIFNPGGGLAVGRYRRFLRFLAARDFRSSRTTIAASALRGLPASAGSRPASRTGPSSTMQARSTICGHDIRERASRRCRIASARSSRAQHRTLPTRTA